MVISKVGKLFFHVPQPSGIHCLVTLSHIVLWSFWAVEFLSRSPEEKKASPQEKWGASFVTMYMEAKIFLLRLYRIQ